ncbi:hypothetical protein KCU71_g61, partial [Aureobasidium melanogenum]
MLGRSQTRLGSLAGRAGPRGSLIDLSSYIDLSTMSNGTSRLGGENRGRSRLPPHKKLATARGEVNLCVFLSMVPEDATLSLSKSFRYDGRCRKVLSHGSLEFLSRGVRLSCRLLYKCLPAVSQSAPLYGAVSLDCSLTLSITTSYCPCFVATNASRSQGQPLSATPDAPSAFPSSTNSKRKDSLISVLMGSKRLHEVHMIEQNTLLPRVTVHMSHDCDCRDIPDDGSGVDELLALGMDGTASLEESERMLVLGLTDCIDAFEGVLVDSASQNSLVVKDVFVDHKANLNDLMVAAPVGEFSGPE